MSNPWLKKNPLMSMWLSGANSIANTARARIALEAKRQTSTAVTRASNEMVAARTGLRSPATSKRKKKDRVPGV